MKGRTPMLKVIELTSIIYKESFKSNEISSKGRKMSAFRKERKFKNKIIKIWQLSEIRGTKCSNLSILWILESNRRWCKNRGKEGGGKKCSILWIYRSRRSTQITVIKNSIKWAIHLKYKVLTQQDQKIMAKMLKYTKNTNNYWRIDKNPTIIFITE